MKILVTGVAGFIGSHVTRMLLTQGYEIIGIDSVNDYYDVELKKARLAKLQQYNNFHFYKFNIAQTEDLFGIATSHADIEGIVHLAAQAGVRYSLSHPFAYAEANLVGHLAMLELAKRLNKLKHFVYASSSSVYGANTKLPFSIEDPTDHPISLYAATKKSCELMSYCYSHLYQMPTTGLRYFTVYGPWGRPDMSAFLFTKAILNDEEISVFNHGDMRRNFSFIDDIARGTVDCLFKVPKLSTEGTPFRIYNLGNNRSEHLLDFIKTIEQHLGRSAKMKFEPMQPGDVKNTIADITESERDFGFVPTTNIDVGLKQFVDWYRDYYHVK